MKWAELNTTEVAALPADTVCVLPLGAIEQHGPHLPLATDEIIATTIAMRLDAVCNDNLLILPTLSVTCSQHHMAFSGTLSISHDVFISQVRQVIISAARHGFRRFFVLNAHGGNIAATGVACEQLGCELPECDILWATWFHAAAERLHLLIKGPPPAVGHACEFETSVIMAVRPELVNYNAITDEAVAPTSPLLYSDLVTPARIAKAIPFDQLTNSGVWGKPTRATAEKGALIINTTVEVLRELLAAHWTATPGLEQRRQADPGDDSMEQQGAAP